MISLLGIVLPAGTLVAAGQAAKPAFSVQVSPASQSAVRGASAAFGVTITSQNGFAGSVSLSATSIPDASSASFSSATVNVASGATATSTLTVSTTSSTPVGTYALQIQGASGKTSVAATAGLTVNYALSGSISLTSTPASVSIAPGSAGAYSLGITRSNLPGPVSLSVSGLPAGVTAAFNPNPATGSTATLQLTAAANAPSGQATLYIVGSGQDAAGKTQYAYASVQFEVLSNGKAFSISGSLSSPLAPGVTRSVDLALTNPNSQPLSVTNLSVTVSTVTRTAAATAQGLPCTAADFAISQYSGPYPLTIPSGTSSLSGLGVPSSQRPTIGMLDAPANQDGCKGATVTFAYSGSGQGK